MFPPGNSMERSTGRCLTVDGNVLVNDIPMMMISARLDEGDQRLNEVTYNPDKNQFLVCWTDMAPSSITSAYAEGS